MRGLARNSLMRRLALRLVLLIGAAAVISGAIAATRAQSLAQDAAGRRAAVLARLLTDRYAPLLERPDELRSLVREDAVWLDVHVTVLDGAGRGLADSAVAADRMDAERFMPEVRAAMNEGAGRAHRRGLPPEGGRRRWTMYAAVRHDATPGRGAVVRVGAPTRLASAVGGAIVQTGAVAALALIACAVALIALSGATLERDASRLERRVARIGRKGRMRDIPPPESGELAALATTLESTLATLTDQVRTLSTQRGEAKAILRSMPGAVIALDAEGRAVNTNRVAEAMLGIDPDDSRGRLLEELVRQPPLLDFAETARNSLERHSAEFEVRGESPLIVSATSRPLLDADGAHSGAVIVLQDVTRLRRLERMRRDFAANASHELRTPVTNIMGYVETLEEIGEEDPEQTRRFVRIIRRNAERLAAIIEDVLELARLEEPDAGAGLGLTRTPLKHLLDEVASTFQPQAEKRAIRLTIDAPEPISASVNPGLLRQALGNLVANAVRYSPEGTEVRIGLRTVSDDGAKVVEISVEDEGPGIPEEHMPRIFERFYRIDPARSRQMGGTGLGLAIAKHVALLHGGDIGVNSEEGRGSRFWIRLPATRRPAAEGASPSAGA